VRDAAPRTLRRVDKAAGTTATYERIADEYAQRWGAADHLSAQRADFAGRLPHGGLIADLGCGPGRDTAGFAGLGLRVVALDRAGAMLALVRRRDMGLPVRADLRHLPLADASVDGAWACASLLHLAREDLPQALDEIARVLRPAGLLWLSVKRGRGDWWRGEDSLKRFFALYTEEELDDRLAAAGLAVSGGSVSRDPLGREAWITRLAVRPASHPPAPVAEGAD